MPLITYRAKNVCFGTHNVQTSTQKHAQLHVRRELQLNSCEIAVKKMSTWAGVSKRS
eukprot:m.717677 g.717677  ORF g.717677 m.717677 type:complete len:57 (-) comp22987_c2_seq1:21-191(-)